MPNQVLQDLADRMPDIDARIDELEELVAASQEADQDVTAQKGELERLKIQRTKWKTMLQSRGYLK